MKDPDEWINFYADPEYKDVAEKLQQELMDQIKRYNDPIVPDLKT